MPATFFKSPVTALLGLFLASGCTGSRVADRTAPPRLAVVIVVDQMRADYLTRFADQYTGGLARLLHEGVVFTEAHQDHAVTATAPGHASIATGLFPQHHGIVANAWWDRAARRSVYAVEDTTALLALPGTPGSSPANLLRATLGDHLKRTSPKSKVYAVALKDRAAVLMAGHDAEAAFWYYDPLGHFVTTTYYLDAYPRWVTSFNTSGRVDAYFETGWTRLLDEDAYRASREDDFPAEAGGAGTTFPHRFTGPEPGPVYYSELRRTPFGDDLTFAFARDLVRHERLGRDKSPDLLFIGASAADGIGHAYGPYSQETQDYYLRLDRMLQDFLAFLDQTVGREAYLVALTADHGVLPMPEELQRRAIEAGRIDLQRLLAPSIEQIRDQFGLDELPIVFSNGLVLDLPTPPSSDTTSVALRTALAKTFRALDAVEDAVTYDELATSTVPERPFLESYRRSFYPDRAPDVMFRLKEHFLPFGQPTGTSHGSPYPYDTHVPLLFLAASLSAAHHTARVRTVDIAPTLAALLGLPVPADLDGQILSDVQTASVPPPRPIATER